ncbi:DUF2306 domain-containing protein [bacterium]|nr:DUF2306 domain-containing protein [bacterium]
MWVKDAILTAHVVFGTVALVLGPVAMTARKVRGLHTEVGEAYHWVVLGVCLSAGILSVMGWSRIWWFFPIASGSYAFALLGYVAAKRRWKGWLGAHLTGQGGSYIAMCTALLVVNWQSLTGIYGIAALIAWVLPTIIGTPIIAWISRQVAQGKRPKLR